MMKYYQEITLIPDAEIPPDFLWTKVYAQIHLAFADRENIDHKQIYGVSFPNMLMNLWEKRQEFLHRKKQI